MEAFRSELLTLCLPSTNPPCATLFWGTLELGRHLEVLCSTRCIFLPVNRMENSKKVKLITHADSATPKTMVIASLSNTNEQ